MLTMCFKSSYAIGIPLGQTLAVTLCFNCRHKLQTCQKGLLGVGLLTGPKEDLSFLTKP